METSASRPSNAGECPYLLDVLSSFDEDNHSSERIRVSLPHPIRGDPYHIWGGFTPLQSRYAPTPTTHHPKAFFISVMSL